MSDEKATSSGDPAKRRRRRRRKGAAPAPAGGEATGGAPTGGAPTGGAPTGGSAKGEGIAQARPARPDASRRRRGAKSPQDKPRGGQGQEGRPPRPSQDGGAREARDDKGRDGRGRGRGRSAEPETKARTAPTASKPPERERERERERESRPPGNDSAKVPAEVQERVRWGDDGDAPTKEISALLADLPANAAASDWDPTSSDLHSQGGYLGDLSARISNVIGVRFVTAGRLYLYDGGEGCYEPGDRVVVEADRGERIGTVGAQSSRQPPVRSLKRVLRRAGDESEVGAVQGNEQRAHLSKAKALAKEMGLPIKVFRASLEQGRLAIYYSCDDKTDVRRLTRALSDSLPLPVELRHFGVRDEAKLVGGIGSCGMELCCTTWLPAFVPVSIKNAKDQGLVLNPTKVSGQCGRLKCCLVYEQAQYAEMRKGLPKLGKRVVTNDGFEGRVIEVDVLHQRFRVSVGRGESKVYQKGEVEPMFASQAQGANPPGTPTQAQNAHEDDTRPAPNQDEALTDKKDE